MRIIGGDFKGRTLAAPKGRSTRPTSQRTREALFNVLTHAPWAPSLNGARIIDLFAGSGALGFEALSRGAAFGLFVEIDGAARGAIRENQDTLKLFGVSRVLRRSATLLGDLPAGLAPSCNIGFIDPPYGKNLVRPALVALTTGGWLTPEAVVVVETAREEEVDFTGWHILDARTYGAAQIIFIRQA